MCAMPNLETTLPLLSQPARNTITHAVHQLRGLCVDNDNLQSYWKSRNRYLETRTPPTYLSDVSGRALHEIGARQPTPARPGAPMLPSDLHSQTLLCLRVLMWQLLRPRWVGGYSLRALDKCIGRRTGRFRMHRGSLLLRKVQALDHAGRAGHVRGLADSCRLHEGPQMTKCNTAPGAPKQTRKRTVHRMASTATNVRRQAPRAHQGAKKRTSLEPQMGDSSQAFITLKSALPPNATKSRPESLGPGGAPR